MSKLYVVTQALTFVAMLWFVVWVSLGGAEQWLMSLQ